MHQDKTLVMCRCDHAELFRGQVIDALRVAERSQLKAQVIALLHESLQPLFSALHTVAEVNTLDSWPDIDTNPQQTQEGADEERPHRESTPCRRALLRAFRLRR